MGQEEQHYFEPGRYDELAAGAGARNARGLAEAFGVDEVAAEKRGRIRGANERGGKRRGNVRRSDLARISRRAGRRRAGRLPGAHRAGHGRARRSALDPGPSGARPCGALELQSREVRLLFGGSEWPPAFDLQDPHGFAATERADYRFSAEVVSADQGSGHRRFLELSGEQEDSRVPAEAGRGMEDGPTRRGSG